MHEQMRREKGLASGAKKADPAGYQDIGAKQGNEKHLKITFAVIEKMHYSDFNSGNDAEDFKPSDIIDEEDAALSDDEVLRKFKHDKLGLLAASEFDQKLGPKQASKEMLLDSGPLGLKQKGSPRIPDTTIATKNVETLRRAGVAKGAPYLIDPLQEKIHTLKNQLQQQIGSTANRPAGLQKHLNSKSKASGVGEPILSQQNLASHNQKMNPVTHREQQQNQDPIRPAKKRAGASTDMVPKRATKPLTDVRNFEPPAQFDVSP